MTQTAVFIALQASIDAKDRGSATSALFLIGPMAATIVMAIGSALIVAGLRDGLFVRLTALGLDAASIQEVGSLVLNLAWITKHSNFCVGHCERRRRRCVSGSSPACNCKSCSRIVR